MRFIRNPKERTPSGHTRDAIVRMILARGHRVGDKLPAYRDLAAYLDVAVPTVVRAMHQLAKDGVVRLLHGKGAFVRKLPTGGGKLSEVGLVYPASRLHLVRTPYLSQILAGIVMQCDANQIDLQIVALRQPGKPGRPPLAPREVALRVDGVLLLEVTNEEYIREFAKESVPLVLVDSQGGDPPVAAVCVDNAAAVRQVMEHLHGLGHRRIAYADAMSEDSLARPGRSQWIDSADGRERREAYLAETKRLGLAYQRIYAAPDLDPVQAAAAAVRQFLQDRSRPTAILAYDGPMAGALCGLLQKEAIRVPGEVSLAGVVGPEGTNVAGTLTVTGSIVRFEEMGHWAMLELLARAKGKRGGAVGPRRIGSVLQVGTSTDVPPGT